MDAIPSIKGSAFASLAEDVGKLLAAGTLARTDAARWLRPEDFALLEEPVVVSRWYDIRCYARMTELLRDVEGGGSNEYVKERGRRVARRLLEAGLYAQLRYVQRAEVSRVLDAHERFVAYGRDLRLLTTISGSMLNFSRWSSMPDGEGEGRYRIEVSEARDYPEMLCWSSEGFVNGIASERGEADLWRWVRPAPDLVVFHMTRPL